MKLLVFAHTPPPHHGQSYMIQLMVEGFGGDRDKGQSAANDLGIECYHVNARFSRSLQDVGEFQGWKIFLIFFYCFQAVWLRFRHGVTAFYYVPAPGKSVALYRDWLVMLLCRPFFKTMILHWHAAGLGRWLETSAQMRTRATTYRLFKPVDLSIVLSKYNVADAEKLLSRRIEVVNNGIPDPCPDFERRILPRRRARLAARRKIAAGGTAAGDGSETGLTGSEPDVLKALYMAHCTRSKGLFDAMEGAALANQALEGGHRGLRVKLAVAGNFPNTKEREEFEGLLGEPRFAGTVDYLGFVSGTEKEKALGEADVFCFPTYYFGENQPVNLIEAMAFGLAIVTTRWRSLPEFLPAGYPGVISAKAPDEVAAALVKAAMNDDGGMLRRHFLEHFTLEKHLANLAQAIRNVES